MRPEPMSRGRTPPPSPTRFATSFVGRATLLAAAAKAISEHRVVTLLGPPGAGKSRLAAELLGRFPERFAWCAIEGVSSSDEVAARLAEATGARLIGEPNASLEALGAALRRRFDRVVLDGAESAQPDLAAFVAELLGAAPQVRVLVTSRARLGAEGEALLEVPPLDTSPGGEAEQLFVERARLVRPDFSLDDAGRAELSALVRSLDGLPLAIEIAAARSRFVPLGALVSRVLAGAGAGDPALPLAIERSVEELSIEAQRALAELSVLRGGFSVEAAEAVVSGPCDVLSALSELADRSLLSTQGTGRSPRLSMLGSVRAAAERRLPNPAHAPLRDRHLAYFAALAERCTHEEAEDPASLRRDLALERDNLAAAIEHARATRSPSRLSVAIGWAALHQGTGPLTTLFADLDATLRSSSDSALPLRARALLVLTGIARDLDRCGDVLPLAEALVSEAADARESGALAVAEAALGEALTALGRFDEGARALEDARKMERVLSRSVREARVLHALGTNRVEAGKLGEGRLALREALALLDGRDAVQQARTLAVLGVIDIEEGRLAEARDNLDRALPIAEESRDLRLFAMATTNHAAVAHESGDVDVAALEYERGAEICRAAGMRRGEALARAFVGHCHIERGRFGAARAAYEESLARLAKEGWRHTMVLAPYAAAVAMEGDVDLAARTLDEAEASLRAMGQERLSLAVHVWRGFLDLAEADRLRAFAAPETAALARVEAARRRTLSTLVDPTPRPSGGGGPALAQQSTDLRVALRALSRAVAERAPAPVAPEAAWEVRSDGSVLVSPTGDRTDLTRRAALRRIAARLASERVASPGDVVTVEALVAAGWPGESIAPKAGEARVYAAVATLRKLGLAGLLQSTGDGYRLDPRSPLRLHG